MRIGKQKVELLNPQSYEELTEKIEIAGRVCYQSEPKGDPEKFIRMIIKRGHESVLEHGSLTFKVRTNRAIANEIVRHRLASYSQESTRYVKYDDIEFIPGEKLKDPNLENLLLSAELAYKLLLTTDFKPEEARDILPNATATTLVMTMNFRELRHFLKLRLDKAAHPQIRELAGMILEILKEKYPVFVEDIEKYPVFVEDIEK
ncbi:FAD-dependent thymidylate synthase [uncultured Peptoniphilus sp.]|uniref:FAD-dependent thymidylate synthase n=1 Tax=uncultured Peptoniphilus sp. TaxID=254354 RepID=UPI002597E961|nr:FAD-dependent thymidylate synthase [uncultured Peptoniphilus sp.]